MKRADNLHVEQVMDLLELWMQKERGAVVSGIRQYPDRTNRNQKACDAILATVPKPTAVELTAHDAGAGD